MRFFGLGRKYDWRQHENMHSGYTEEHHHARQSTNKVFADDEGEYVDFEEIAKLILPIVFISLAWTQTTYAQTSVRTKDVRMQLLQDSLYSARMEALEREDYKAAYTTGLEFLLLTDSLAHEYTVTDLQSYQNKLDHQRLIAERTRLEVEGTQLELKRATSEHAKDSLQLKEQSETLEQQQLILQQRRSEAQLQQREQEQHLIEMDEAAKNARARTISMLVINSVVVLFIVLGLAYAILIRRSRKRLRREQAEAVAARQHAEEQSRVRDEFISRTRGVVYAPLNRLIETVSQLDKKKNEGESAEVRKNLLHDLAQNTEKILELFDEIDIHDAPKSIMRSFLVLAFVLGFGGSSLHAQSNANPYGIRNDLFDIYQRAERVADQPQVLKIADSLFAIGNKIHDVQVQAMAYNLKGRYALMTKDLATLRHIQKNLESLVRGTPHEWFLFHNWDRIFVYYLSQGQMANALNELERYQTTAAKYNNSYGISLGWLNTGHILCMQNMSAAAVDYYQKVLKAQLSGADDRDLALTYLDLGKVYMELGKRFLAIQNLRAAVKAAKYEWQLPPTYNELFRFFVENEALDSATAAKTKLEALLSRNVVHASVLKTYYNTCAHYWAQIGDSRKALQYLDSIGDDYPRTHMQVYALLGDYAKADTWLLAAFDERSKTYTEANINRLAAFEVNFENALQEEENIRIQLKNNKIELDRLRSEQEMQHQQARTDSIMVENNKLKLQEQENEAALRHQAAERAAVKAQGRLKRERFRFYFASGLIFAGILILTFIVLRLRSRRIEQRRMKIATARIKNSRDLSVKADQKKAEFLKEMRHEMRTPLNAIKGFADMLYSPDMDDMPLSDEERKEMNDSMNQNITMLQLLVNEAMELSEWDAGKRTITPRKVNVVTLVKKVVENAHPAEGVKMTLNLPEEHLTLLTDEHYLEEALKHLMNNACKFTSEGEITIACDSPQKNEVQIAITNTAPPIPTDKARYIFHRFAKLDSFQPGLGLGLSLCEVIVSALHGRVFLDTSYNDGVRFVIVLRQQPETSINS